MSRGFSFGESRTLECPLLAQSGHTELHRTCPLLGGKAEISRTLNELFLSYIGPFPVQV
jgi:hypothetical protein